jgi:acid stress-induced BolA-like protein IbaG/YrbA
MSDTVCASVKSAIEQALPGALAKVHGGGGHYEIAVTYAAFEGKGTLDKQRTVLRAIKHLMAGDEAPVHAVDRLECKAS